MAQLFKRGFCYYQLCLLLLLIDNLDNRNGYPENSLSAYLGEGDGHRVRFLAQT
jgi:hypothetical protein